MISRREGLIGGLVLAGLLQGCNPLENKPKDPVSPEGASVRWGTHSALAVKAGSPLALYAQSVATPNEKYVISDYYSPAEDGGLGLILSGEYEVDRDDFWLTDADFSYILGSWEASGDYWYMLDTQRDSLTFHVRGSDLEDQSITEFDIEVVDGEYTCLSHRPDGDREVVAFDLSVAGGNGVLTETSPDFPSTRSVQLTAQTQARLEVTGFASEFPRTCAGAEPSGFSNSFFDELTTTYTSSSSRYDICWESKAVGAFHYEGEVLFFEEVGLVSVNEKRLFDANNDGFEDTSGELMPENFVDLVDNETGAPGADGLHDTVRPNLPSDIANMLQTDLNGLTGFDGYRPVNAVNYCVRKATDLTNASLSEQYWVGTVFEDSGEAYVAFSVSDFDGLSRFSNDEIRVSTSRNTRDTSGSYFVESDGALQVDGRLGIASRDGNLIIYDVSDAPANRSGLAIGIRQPRFQPEVSDEE